MPSSSSHPSLSALGDLQLTGEDVDTVRLTGKTGGWFNDEVRPLAWWSVIPLQF